LRFVPSVETCTKYVELWTLQNNLGFSLYAVLSVYYNVGTSEDNWSPRKVSFNKKEYFYKILEFGVNNIH